MERVEVRVSLDEGAVAPSYQSEGAAGADVAAYLTRDLLLAPGERALIPTGVRIAEIPQGYEIQVRSRSGLAWHQGVTVGNSPGTIDSDYRGEIQVLLINHGKEPFTVTRGMRIAQLVIAPVVIGCYKEVAKGGEGATKRGDRGFGHTGIS